MMSWFSKKRNERANQILALKRLQGTPEGDLIIKYMLEITHVMDASIGETPNDTYFAEGERSIGLQIIRALEMPADKLIMLLKEEDINE